MADNNKKIVYTIKVESKSGEINVKNLSKQIKGLDAEINKVRVSTNEYAKTNQNMVDKTGLAGATLVELGRTVSDLPYGFRGIANNLSQLSTLMTTLIMTTGGLKQGFDSLMKAFRGPLGYIVVFQAVIAAIDYFTGSTKKAKEETDKLNDSLQIQIDKFNALAKIEFETAQQRTKRGTVERTRIKKTGEDLRQQVKILSAEFKEFDKMFSKLSDYSDENVNVLVDDFLRLLQIKKAQSDLEKKISDEENYTLGERSSAQRNLNNLILERIDIENKYSDKSIKNNSISLGLKEEEIEINFDLKESELELADARVAAYDAELEKNEFLLKFKKENALERIDLEEEVALKNLDSYYEDIDNTLFYQQEKQKILDYYANLRGEISDREAAKERANFKSRLSEISREINNVNKILFSSFESQRQMEIDQVDARTQTLLANQSLTEKQRIDILKDAEEQKAEIGRQAIKQELKMAQISAGIQATQLALQILADQGALGAKLSLGAGKTLGDLGFPAAIPALIAYAASAAAITAQFVAAKSKAKAAEARLGSFAGSYTGAGGGAGISAPDFNVVGASPESQLAQTVQSQQQKPLRAFVVHKDIKNASELDRNITETSALG